MPIDPEKLAIGRALVAGELGGALPASALAAVVETTREAFALGRDPAAWPDYLLAALAEVDSALELSAARAVVIREHESAMAIERDQAATLRGLLAAARGEWPLELRPMQGERQTEDGAAIRSNAAWRELAAVAIRQREEKDSRYRAESLRCNSLETEARELRRERDRLKGNLRDCERAESASAMAREALESDIATLQERNDTQSGTITNLTKERDSLQSELAEAREALAEWRAKAMRAEAHCERFQAVALAVGATPIGELPARILAAYTACTDRGAARNRMERESGDE